MRSSKQDYIHASIVSTLLALMDGLDSRGQVILIGATNRIDSLDAALRRPGRFDRELQFGLPNASARSEILRIHTKSWAPPPAADLVTELSSRTHGYCGADLKALCAESALRALHDAYPQLLGADEKYVIDPSAVSIRREHFIHALSVLTPAAHRALSVRSAPLPDHLRPMLQPALEDVLARLKEIFPPTAGGANAAAAAFRGACTSLVVDVGGVAYPSVCRPRLLLTGPAGNGQDALGAATLRALEHCTLYSLDLPLLVSDGSRSPQEACAHVFAEARRTLPSVVLLPSLDAWLLGAEPLLFSTLLLLLEQVPAAMPLLVLGTSGTAAIDLDDGARRRISQLFPRDWYELRAPAAPLRRAALGRLSADVRSPPPPPVAAAARVAPAVLQRAPPPPPPAPTVQELRAVREEEECELRQMRMALREICMRLGSDRRFREWSRVTDVQTEEGAAYIATVGYPMELATLLQRVNERLVSCASSFEAHLRRIVACAAAHHTGDDEHAFRQLARAHTLLDEGLDLIATIDPDLVERNEQIATARAERGEPQADPTSKVRPRARLVSPKDGAAAAPAVACAARARAASCDQSAAIASDCDSSGVRVEPAASEAQLPAGGEARTSVVDVQVDVPRLEMLVERMVTGTEGWRVEQVELLLTDVFSAVDAHRNDTDRTSLLEAIESKYEALCAAFV